MIICAVDRLFDEEKTTEEDLGTFVALRKRAREENSPLKNDLHMFVEYIVIVAMPKHLNKKELTMLSEK